MCWALWRMPGSDAARPAGNTYAYMYGSSRGVYEEARYFAEPTTRLRYDLRGANMVKAESYPFFMPYLVEMAFFLWADGLFTLGRAKISAALLVVTAGIVLFLDTRTAALIRTGPTDDTR